MVKKGFFKYIGIVPLLTIISIFALSGSYLIKSGHDTNISGLRKITNGLHICFGRVQQTYTSTIIGAGSSNYINNKFYQNTEECFGEIINVMQTEVSASFSLISKKINTLAKEVHWFHNKVETKDGKLIKGRGFALDRRFNDLETLIDKISERIDRRINSQNSKSSTLTKVILALFTLTLVLILLSTQQEFKLKKDRDELNIIAEIELSKENINPNKAIALLKKMSSIFRTGRVEELAYKIKMQSARSRNIISDDFRDFEPPSKYNLMTPSEPIIFNMDEEKSDSEEVAENTNEVLVPVQGEIKEEVSNTILTTAEVLSPQELVDSEIENQIEIFNLDTVLAESVRSLVSVFFSQGIEIDFRIDKGIEIKGSNESLGQVLHNVLVSSLNLNNDISKITIEAEKIEEKTLVQIIDNSKKGFSTNFTQNQNSLAYPHDTSLIGLVLCKELMKDLEGTIEFENLLASDQEVVGTLRTITLNNAISKKRLSYVRKGTKADLLKSFNS